MAAAAPSSSLFRIPNHQAALGIGALFAPPSPSSRPPPSKGASQVPSLPLAAAGEPILTAEAERAPREVGNFFFKRQRSIGQLCVSAMQQKIVVDLAPAVCPGGRDRLLLLSRGGEAGEAATSERRKVLGSVSFRCYKRLPHSTYTGILQSDCVSKSSFRLRL